MTITPLRMANRANPVPVAPIDRDEGAGEYARGQQKRVEWLAQMLRDRTDIIVVDMDAEDIARSLLDSINSMDAQSKMVPPWLEHIGWDNPVTYSNTTWQRLSKRRPSHPTKVYRIAD